MAEHRVSSGQDCVVSVQRSGLYSHFCCMAGGFPLLSVDLFACPIYLGLSSLSFSVCVIPNTMVPLGITVSTVKAKFHLKALIKQR